MSIESDIVELRKAFRLPVNSEPGLLSRQDMKLHIDLIQEEFAELLEAYNDDDLTEVFDAVVDMSYVLAGLAVHMGLPLDEGWREVHRSNMSKLDENGEPIISDGTDGFPKGKFLKGPFYSPPRLDVILERFEEFGESVSWRGQAVVVGDTRDAYLNGLIDGQTYERSRLPRRPQ